MKLAKIIKHCRIDKPDKFKLADFDPADSFGLPTDIEEVRPILADGVGRLEDMQERLYAHGRWAVLIVTGIVGLTPELTTWVKRLFA